MNWYTKSCLYWLFVCGVFTTWFTPTYGGTSRPGDCSTKCACAPRINIRYSGGDMDEDMSELLQDDMYDPWGDWSGCSEICGTGVRYRERNCSDNYPTSGRRRRRAGYECGDGLEMEFCNTHECPDGEWSEWGGWGDCSASCGGGVQIRERTCDDQGEGGHDCHGDSQEVRVCNTDACSDSGSDGVWTDWANWGDCSVSCGGGVEIRERTCGGDGDCHGDTQEVRVCSTGNCPAGGWSSTYGGWSDCTCSCGGGVQTRERTCTNPRPGIGSADCVGSAVDIRKCNEDDCPLAAPRCESGWVLHKRNCYLFVVCGTCTVAHARDACVDDHDAMLVKISSQDVRDFIRSQIGVSSSLAIGAVHIATPDTWLWGDGTHLIYNYWYPSQPGAGTGDCAVMQRTDDYGWRAVPCTHEVAGYACERIAH